MQIIEKVLPVNHELFLAGDIHEGSLMVHEHGLKRLVSMMQENKNAYLVLMGDIAEAICVDDKRYNRTTENPATALPLQQYQRMVERFKPIKDRILFCLEGNHDYTISNKFGNCVQDIFCKELGIPYGTASAKLIIKTKADDIQYKAFLTHYVQGVSSSADDPIRRESNMKLSLKRRLSRKAGDCILMACGHIHKLIVSEPAKDLFLVDVRGKVQQRYTKYQQTADYIHPDMRYYCSTGSFLKLYGKNGISGYAERFGYDPVELGFLKVSVKNGILQGVEKIVLD